LPGTAGFAAEFITFAGSFASVTIAGMKIYTLIAVIGIVLTAGYILWMLQRVFYGYPLEKYNGVGDADTVEKLSTISFVCVIMLVGIYPAILTNVINMGIAPIAKLIGV
jgi:NADH-quinone oxidoreductase subunit M